MGWTIPIWLLLSAILILLLFASLPGRCSQQAAAPFRGVNHAHRGLHNEVAGVPENSLAAFRAAVERGYGIELDIQLTKDGQVVVFHDDDLARMCGQSGLVLNYTYNELLAFDLLTTGESIPLFTEVLALVAGRVPLIVELKTGPQNAQLCRAAMGILAGYSGPYCVESFDPRIVRWFKVNAPGVFRGQLAAPPAVLESGAAGLLIGWGLSHFLGRPQFIAYQAVKRPPFVRLAGLQALRVAWTLTPKLDIKAFEAKNDAIIFEGYEPAPKFK